MPYRMIQVGTGGFGRVWCERFLPQCAALGLIEVVAAVDVDERALAEGCALLGLPSSRCYSDVREAFARHEADFCTVVVPPRRHEEIIDAALEHGLDILSEKPIADSLESAVRILQKVRAAGRRMAVTMSYRFDQDKWTLRELLRSRRFGDVNYLTLRFTTDTRVRGAWGDASPFRYEMDDPLLIEAGVHHLDLLQEFAAAPCEWVYAETWNPPYGDFAGDSHAFVSARFANGVRALYEGGVTNAIGLNGWGREYIRAECEGATIVLSRREIEIFAYDAGQSWSERAEGSGEKVPLLDRQFWTHPWLVAQFVEWLDGGPPPATEVAANIRSLAMVFAALASSRRGERVRMVDVLDRAAERVSVESGVTG